jgi:hypothetical protein
MDMNGQVLDDADWLEQATETIEEREAGTQITEKKDLTPGATAGLELNVSALGIASVLFPAKPPTAVNARLVRGLSFHDDSKKPRGLAGAAGIFQSIWDEPDDASNVDAIDRGWT